MNIYLFKILYLVVFSLITIWAYFSFDKHVFWYSSYLVSYLFFVLVWFWIYYFFKHQKNKISFSILEILGYFLLNLIFLCFFIFSANNASAGLWFWLFFKIIGFSLLPTIIVFLSYCFWNFITSKIPNFQEETNVFKFITSLSLWFFVFLITLSIVWYLWFYNLYVVFWIFTLFIAFSHKEIIENIKKILTHKFEIEWHDFNLWNFNFNLLTREIAFFVIIFVIWINLVNIVRPMPIWWDDLWVYMNFPKMLASMWELKNLWWMMSWQIFTWIGYMFWSATQAFFLNNVWWVLSVVFLVLIFSDLLKSTKPTFINIPFVLTSIFISMPMIVFQQAKDMKVDPGLFFVSIASIYILYYVFAKYVWYQRDLKTKNFELTQKVTPDEVSIEVISNSKFENTFLSYFSKYTHIWNRDIFENKSYLIYIFIAWILAWFAFSIKITSLLLISWAIWLIFYVKLGFSGFLAYVSMYFWIFSKFWLWSMLNVSYPKDDTTLLNYVFVVCVWISVWLFLYSLNKYSFKTFKQLFVVLWIFLAWIITSLSSNIIYNYYSLDNLSIHGLISWKTIRYIPDFEIIHSKKDLAEIESKYISNSTTSTGTTNNEDLWRYFWYESWINNYVKLPYNLTMQTNQSWEFTDITFVYFALIPLILFLSYKWNVFVWVAWVLSFLPLIFFLPKDNILYSNFTQLLSNLTLPGGYLVLFFAFFLVPFVFFLFWLNKEKFSMLFRLNLVFSLFYVFLWTISAFWIVWYWIAMYFNFLLFIWIWLYYVSNYNEKDFNVKLLGSIFVYLIIIIFYLLSVFPQAFWNLTWAWYLNFKAWNVNSIKSVFIAQPNYYKSLLELNINPEKYDDLYKKVIASIDNNQAILQYLVNNKATNLVILENVLLDLYNSDLEANIKNKASKALDVLYKEVYSPSKEFKNDSKIYRIWTFYKYFVDNNITRFLEDGLLFTFDRYFYDENDLNKSIERLKKLDVKYLLVDLNAATIDKDARRDLTRRYENILKTFSSDKLELVNTDSVCLKIALENYNKSEKSQKDLQDFMLMSGVNYESYTSTWAVINRGEKLFDCYNFIVERVWYDEINENNYSYLLPVYNYIIKHKFKFEDTDTIEVRRYKESKTLEVLKEVAWRSFFALFRIKD